MALSKDILTQSQPPPILKYIHPPATTQPNYTSPVKYHIHSQCKKPRKLCRAPTMPWPSYRVLLHQLSRRKHQTSKQTLKQGETLFDVNILSEFNSFRTVPNCPQQRSKPCKALSHPRAAPHYLFLKIKTGFISILSLNRHPPAHRSGLSVYPQHKTEHLHPTLLALCQRRKYKSKSMRYAFR